MARGYFDFLTSDPTYAGAKKDWHATLQQSTFFWYELIVNPPSLFDTKLGITLALNELRKHVEKTLEKRFIYFFASRPRVRFDVTVPPTFDQSSKCLVLQFLVGRDRKPHVVQVGMHDQLGNLAAPNIELSDKYIRIVHGEESSQSYSVHDFLQRANIPIGAFTKVHYVGITKDPGNRPLSRNHRGIADTLYNVSNEEFDFFLYINIFTVTTVAANSGSNITYTVPNSMTDEIKTHDEGAILEGTLIAYFGGDSQKLNREKEKASLRNYIDKISRTNRIGQISMHLEVDQPSEYFAFSSDSVVGAPSHTFLIESVGGVLRQRTFGSEAELLTFLYPDDDA